MKLNEEVSPVEISGAIGSPQAFQIKASKEAFKILSSGLYNNKILAIIRELSCNAYDAHVAAGKREEPFEVHLPTRLEPHFSVRDNGIGMSDEQVHSLYTTYFSTDKSASNDFVGALGLGSKSPFSYTEGFTVVSRHQGVRRTYACYINEQGTPDILLQLEESTDEHNGLEVSFPVKVEDCWEFENQAKAAFEFFNPIPNLNTPTDITKKEYTFKTDKWGVRKEAKDYYRKAEVRAIQGMVPYNIGTIDKSRMTSKQQSMLELALDIFFPIGDLSVAASRESLSNDDRTISNILKAIDEIGADFINQVKIKLKQCKTLWEGRLMIYNLINTPGFGGVVNDAFNNGELDGDYGLYSFVKNELKINEFDYPEIQIVYLSRNSSRVYPSKQVLSSDDKRRQWANSYGKDSYNISFKLSSDTIFVINDLGFGAEKYVNYFLQESDDRDGKSKVYYITRRHKDVLLSDVFHQGKKIIKALGNPPFVLASKFKSAYQAEIEANKPKSQPTVKKEYITFDLKNVIICEREGRDGTKYSIQGWREGWQLAPAPTQFTQNFYVHVKNLVAQGGEYTNAKSFQSFVRDVVNSGFFNLPADFKVYGFIPDAWQLKSQKGWTEFTAWVWAELKKLMTPTKELELSLYIKPFNIGRDYSKVFERIFETKPLVTDSPFQQFCTIYANAKNQDETKISYLLKVIAKAKEKNLYQVNNVLDFSAMFSDVLAKYPLIQYLSSPIWNTNNDKYMNAVIEYLKMMDEKLVPKPAVFILDKQEEGEEENVTVN